MLKVKAIKIKKGETTMNENNQTYETTKEVEIPEYKELSELLGCSNCTINCPCSKTRSWPDPIYSKWKCVKEKRKIRIIEILIGILLEIAFILASYFIFHNFFVTLLIAILIIAGMCWFDYEFLGEILEKKYKEKELKRKKVFDQKVEEAKKQNELNSRLARGETDEFFAFKENINDMAEKLEEIKSKIFSYEAEDEAENEAASANQWFNSYVINKINAEKNKGEIENTPEMDANFKIKDMFEKFTKNLDFLNIQITPFNFNYSYIQAFYTNYLPSFYKNINIYFEKKSQGMITFKEEEAFEKLLDSFNLKVEQVTQSLNEQDEISFLSKMEDLQNSLNSLKKSEE